MAKWHEPSDHPHLPDGFHSPPLLMEIQYPGDIVHFRTGYAVKCGEDGEDSVIYLTDDDLCVQGYAMKRWVYVFEIAASPSRTEAAWTEDPDGTWTCSRCGLVWVLAEGSPADNEMNYCPKCGARIEGGGWTMAEWHSRKELPKITETGRSEPLLIQVRTYFGNTPYFTGKRHDIGDAHGWYVEVPYGAVEEVTDKSVMRWAYLHDVLEALDNG